MYVVRQCIPNENFTPSRGGCDKRHHRGSNNNNNNNQRSVISLDFHLLGYSLEMLVGSPRGRCPGNQETERKSVRGVVGRWSQRRVSGVHRSQSCGGSPIVPVPARTACLSRSGPHLRSRPGWLIGAAGSMASFLFLTGAQPRARA
jgi:hypothetical protein